jgi:hypothetical protein
MNTVTVRIVENSIVFEKANGTEFYHLPLGALDSPLNIIQHVNHLCDKSWVERQTIQKFVALAAGHYGFPTRGDIGRVP